MKRCATTFEPEMADVEHQLLLDVLQRSGLTNRHLEIGTAAGGTLAAMMGAYTDRGRPPFVVVDPMTYFPQQLEVVRANLEQHGLDPDEVDFRCMTSKEAFQQANQRQESYSFILIDGCHKICSVMEDLRWGRLLEVGGYLAIHDVSPVHRGVQWAVERFRKSCGDHYELVEHAGTLMMLEKKQSCEQPEVSAADEWYAWCCHWPLQIERKWQRLRRAA